MQVIAIEFRDELLQRDTEQFAAFVVAMLETLTPMAQRLVARLPPLYRAGVRFCEETPGYESFVTPNLVFERGRGDCAHLCLWRVAELRNAGEAATYKIAYNDRDMMRRLFHVQVRRGTPKNLPTEKRPFEDPSVLLGMSPGGYPL